MVLPQLLLLVLLPTRSTAVDLAVSATIFKWSLLLLLLLLLVHDCRACGT
jgi:hypothetical protein